MNDTSFENCIKCTVCTTACPVSRVNPGYPGPKQAGPDGERLRLKDGALYDEALKYCINCKRCEVACPSDVKIGDIIQRARANATLLIGLLMVRKILKLRGISGEMLKTAWRGNFRRLLALNRDIMLRSLLLQLCFGAITVLGARLGSDIIAVNAVLMTLLTFTAYALDGFAYAVEAHSGQAYGARDGSQLLDVWRAACRQSGIVALLFSVVYLLAGEHIIALLTSLTQIQQLADRYLIWQVILPLVGVWCYLLDGMFIGATRAAEMRNSMAVAAAGFALTLLTLPWLGNHGLWLALTVFLALRGLSLAAIWRRHWRNGTWFAAT